MAAFLPMILPVTKHWHSPCSPTTPSWSPPISMPIGRPNAASTNCGSRPRHGGARRFSIRPGWRGFPRIARSANTLRKSGASPQTDLREAAARLRKGIGDGVQVLIPIEIFERDRQPPTPVRMLVEGTGNVGLLQRPHNVVEGNGNEARGRSRKKPGNCRKAAGVHKLISLSQDGVEALSSPGTRFVAFSGIQSKRALCVQVISFQPSAQRWKVMRVEGRKRLLRVRLRRTKTAIPFPFEQHHAICPKAPARNGFAKPFRHRAKVFADDRAARLQTFLGDRLERLLERKSDVGPF